MMTAPLHEAEPDALAALFVGMPHLDKQALVRLWIDEVPIGYLLPSIASTVIQLRKAAVWVYSNEDLHLHTHTNCVQTRSIWMQQLAVDLQKARLISGWRSELYDAYTPEGEVFFQMERSAFRTLGLISQAVHIHGYTETGHVWVAQRSLSKATDPGMWDNLAAGGLPHGQTPHECAVRELWEEAGLTLPLAYWPVQHLSERLEADGVHREWLHVFTTVVPEGTSPANQDGEVQGFELLSPAALIERLNRCMFTWDAAWVSALCLGFSVQLADREKMPQLTHKLPG